MTLLGLLAELFGWLDSLLACALGWLIPKNFGQSKKSFFKKPAKKLFFPNRGQAFFSEKASKNNFFKNNPEKYFSKQRFQTACLEKILFPKLIFDGLKKNPHEK